MGYTKRQVTSQLELTSEQEDMMRKQIQALIGECEKETIMEWPIPKDTSASWGRMGYTAKH